MISYRQFLIIFILLFVFSACDDTYVYKQEYSIENEVWNKENAAEFAVDIKDVNEAYDLYFDIKISDRFKTQNIWMFFEVEAPDGTIQRDTTEYMLFDSGGKTLGENHRNTYEYSLLYKPAVSFPEPGIYRVRVKQGMRKNQTPLAQSVTFIVRKSEFLIKGEDS
ncbi:MAG: gliding motility lipoprotein GldH [Bacteroidota bacterium]|nr:gliding motility lipoprotein GldH [Bacteroidota bacterium]